MNLKHFNILLSEAQEYGLQFFQMGIFYLAAAQSFQRDINAEWINAFFYKTIHARTACSLHSKTIQVCVTAFC